MNSLEAEETRNLEGIIFDIKRFAIHDGPGIRTTIFLKGCPLNCWWCHNPESQKFEIEEFHTNQSDSSLYSKKPEVIGREISNGDLLEVILKDELFYEESNGGVTISGGEPLLQFDFLLNFLKLLRREKIHSALDTSGYCNSRQLLSLSNLVDLFLYDIKIINNDLHKKYTGVSNESILKNLKLLSERRNKIYIRIPIVPAINDDEEELNCIIDHLHTIKGISRIDLLPYHKIGRNKYLKLGIPYLMENIPEPSDEFMKKVKVKFENQGFEVKIGG